VYRQYNQLHSTILGIDVDSKNETYEVQKHYQSDSIQTRGMTIGMILFLFFLFFFLACTMSPRRKTKRSGLFECMDDVKAGRRADEWIIEILMRFLDQLLGFPVSHARGQEERLERWKHNVIIHPR